MILQITGLTMSEHQTIGVEVACATPEKQLILKIEVPLGTSAREAVELSGIEKEFPQLDIPHSAIGVFGEVVQDNCLLKQQDRVEVYRPLINDPRETRRSLAAQGSTMGNRASK